MKDKARIGIDLGGTKIEGIVLYGNGREMIRKRIPTAQDKGYLYILKQISDLTAELKKESQCSSFTFGIGTPGAVSRKTGLLKNSNTECLNEKPFKMNLEAMIGQPIAVENDANCFAQAEATLGAGSGNDSVFGVIMGTGCGGGIVLNGKVLRGHQAIAGEWGHMSIDPQGPECYCGSRGCVETLLSGSGLEKLYQEEFGAALSVPEIVEQYRSQHEGTELFMKRFFSNFGRAVSNLIHVLDPDIIVLGGGLSNIDELYTEGVEEVKKRIFSDSFETPIVKNKMGDSSGVLGAALIGI